MLKVLVVDDEKLVRKGIVLGVDWPALGCIVVAEASNGLEGLEAARKYNPDLIITDIKMPKMDGKEAFALIKEINSEAKIILSSGLSADSEIEMILSSFPDTSFIQKPYRKAQLSEMIQSIVGSNS